MLLILSALLNFIKARERSALEPYTHTLLKSTRLQSVTVNYMINAYVFGGST